MERKHGGFNLWTTGSEAASKLDETFNAAGIIMIGYSVINDIIMYGWTRKGIGYAAVDIISAGLTMMAGAYLSPVFKRQ